MTGMIGPTTGPTTGALTGAQHPFARRLAGPSVPILCWGLAGLGLWLLAAAAAPAMAQTRAGPQTVAPVVEKLIDAVVNISTKQTLKGTQGAPLPKVPKNAAL